MESIALYIHFPYCLYKCHYCDFNSYAVSWSQQLEIPYLEALLREWEIHQKRLSSFEIPSIFLGGSTPSLFSASSIERLLKTSRQSCPLNPDCEITLEANPKTMTP